MYLRHRAGNLASDHPDVEFSSTQLNEIEPKTKIPGKIRQCREERERRTGAGGVRGTDHVVDLDGRDGVVRYLHIATFVARRR